MAKRKAYKADKKRRKERKFRRMENFTDYFLKDSKGRSKIRLVSTEEAKSISPKVIGYINCPFCGFDNMLVMNDRGREGSPRLDYLVRHRNGSRLCEGSEKMLHDIHK